MAIYNQCSCFLASISLVIFLISDFTSNSPGLLLTRTLFSRIEHPKIEASTYSAFIVNHHKKLESLCFHPGSKYSLYHQTSVNLSHLEEGGFFHCRELGECLLTSSALTEFLNGMLSHHLWLENKWENPTVYEM